MKFVIKLFPEIIVKSRPVRKRFIAQLKKNLRKILMPLSENIQISGTWDFVEVNLIDEDIGLESLVLERLKNTSGIDFILKVKAHSYENLQDIADITVKEYADLIKGKTFCVRVKRSGRHSFTSIQVEQKAGGALFHNSESAGVKLKNPEVLVRLEVNNEQLLTVESRTKGLGGFPMGQQESCVSLISGGFDSSVASYLMIKRGIRTHYCFFNLGGIAHEVGVKQVAHYLWEKYASSHRVLFITIPFEEVVSHLWDWS